MLGAPRQHDDGTIAFPERGDVPPEQPGFDRDPGNPWVFKPVMVPCIFRKKCEIKRECKSCEGKPPMTYWACEKCLPVSPSFCRKCIERKE